MNRNTLKWAGTVSPAGWSISIDTLDQPISDIRKEAKALSSVGVNLVFVSGCHYIFDFVDHFERIDAIHGRICEACHEYDIRVIAHHSAILSARVRTKADYSRVPKNHSVPRPPKLGQKVLVDGQDTAEWVAVNARTGKALYFANYLALVFCPNRPGFQQAYKKRVCALLAAGVDGLMSDDYGLTGGWDVCGCPVCREQFTSETGFAFPEPNDENFWENYDNPAWRAWLGFRWQVAGEALLRVKRILGPDRALATCSGSAAVGWHHFSGVPSFIQIRSGVDLCTHEVVFSVLPFYSWRNLASSFALDQAVARRTSTVHVPLFYQVSPDYYRFAFGLSAASGARVWSSAVTPARKRISLALWQKKHHALFPLGEADSQVGLAFSESTHLYWGNIHPDSYVNEWQGWSDRLLQSNIPFRVLMDIDLEQGAFDGLDVIVLPNTACLSRRSVMALRRFHERGGSLVLTHETGLYNHKGERRRDFALKNLIGASYVKTVAGMNLPFVFAVPIKDAQAHGDYFSAVDAEPILNGLRYTVDHWAPQVLVREGKSADVLAVLKVLPRNMAPALLRGPSGRVLYIAGKPGTMCVLPLMRVKTLDGEQASVMRDHREPAFGKLMENCVRSLLNGREQVRIKGVDGWYVRRFTRRGQVVVHVMNLAGANVPDGAKLPDHAQLYSQSAKIPVPVRKCSLDMSIRLSRCFTRCRLHRPGREAGRLVRIRRRKDVVKVTVPARDIGLHAILEFLPKQQEHRTKATILPIGTRDGILRILRGLK